VEGCFVGWTCCCKGRYVAGRFVLAPFCWLVELFQPRNYTIVIGVALGVPLTGSCSIHGTIPIISGVAMAVPLAGGFVWRRSENCLS
jgi:hypothetical protein